MSVTRIAVVIGIMCSVWMTSPLTANAFEKFVGLSDRGSTKVKTCVEDVDDVERKGGRASFSNKNSKFGGYVRLNVDLANGDGIVSDVSDGGDLFDAFLNYNDASSVPLFEGAWSIIDERKNGRKTYQLTPSGDLADDAASGWKELLTLISDEAGDACLVGQLPYYRAISDLVKGTLVVESTKEPKCADIDDEDNRNYNANCYAECNGGSCSKAKVLLDVKAFMNGYETDAWASVKYHWVRFRYKATGYVVGSNPP
jgi:hypothetical protein